MLIISYPICKSWQKIQIISNSISMQSVLLGYFVKFLFSTLLIVLLLPAVASFVVLHDDLATHELVGSAVGEFHRLRSISPTFNVLLFCHQTNTMRTEKTA